MSKFSKIFEGLSGNKKKEEKENIEEKPKQLMGVFKALQRSPKTLDLIAKELFNRNPERFESAKEVKKTLKDASGENYPLEISKLIEKSLGEETLRKITFLDVKSDIEKNVLKILTKDFEKTSFEKQIEKGFYTGYAEDYGVEWSLEKAACDSWQNFFDANGGTLDGIEFFVESDDNEKDPKSKVIINGDANYDWRTLRHTGISDKPDKERAAGGFGEGTKMLSLTMLRDFDADIKFACDDWELEFYLDNIPKDQLAKDKRDKELRGLFIKKYKTEKPIKGNKLEIVFHGEKSKEEAQAITDARELFYSKENEDFQEPSFNDPDVGGFKILPINEKGNYSWERRFKGNFYHAGQRISCREREKWNTVYDVNIWTWKKILKDASADRDRGMVTYWELKEEVLPLIVDAMDKKDLEKSIYDFKSLWPEMSGAQEGCSLLEMMAEKASKEKIKFNFEKEFLARDRMPNWIIDLLKSQGYKICPDFMAKIGMKGVIEKFKELQNHTKIEASEKENEKIEYLKGVAKEIGLDESDIKDIWLFNIKDENSIFSGQYNDLFYWIAQEDFGKDFLDVIDLYFHEAAHKAGSHGNPQFEYHLEELKKKIQKFIFEKRERFEEMDKEWKNIGFTPPTAE
ncbi:MAG: hypothetical protein V1686_01660 [Patescibacteria group bacterium]